MLVNCYPQTKNLDFWAINGGSTAGQAQETGLIRINFKDFRYNPGPYEVASIERLGECHAYYVYVYSSEFIKGRYETNQESIRITGKSGNIAVIDNEKKGSITTHTARKLLEPYISNQILSLFNIGGRLEVVIRNSPLPPYIDIPVPSGKYHLAYAVRFMDAKPDFYEFLSPSYGYKPCAHKNIWGPSSVEVYSNNVTEIVFSPEYRCSSPCEYSLLTMHWENQSVFWDYINYLDWAGEIF